MRCRARLVERFEQLPGVDSAAAAYNSPTTPGWETSFTIVGRPDPPTGEAPEANFRPVTPGDFTTASIPLGHRLRKSSWWETNPDEFEIIGVVGDVRFAGLDAPAEPAMYFPYAQMTVNSMSLLLRTSGDPLLLAEPLRQTIWALDAGLPVGSAMTASERLASTLAERRFLLRLLGAFTGVALGLAAFGIYGVLAYSVAISSASCISIHGIIICTSASPRRSSSSAFSLARTAPEPRSAPEARGFDFRRALAVRRPPI